jgi:Tfp pilus assembly protein PilF
MDIRDYTKAVEIFEKVIEQSPLDKDAELSHTCLIMIYDELGDKVNLQKHIKQLKEDFPDSSALDSLPPEK